MRVHYLVPNLLARDVFVLTGTGGVVSGAGGLLGSDGGCGVRTTRRGVRGDALWLTTDASTK